MLIDWSKLLQPPFLNYNYQNQTPLLNKSSGGILVSAWQGTYTNYVRYVCDCESRARPDLIVAYQPDFTQSPQKLITNWSEDLKTILAQRVPCLLTFATGEEKQRAAQALTTSFHANFLAIQPNEFSSLLLRQVTNKPNHVYAINGFAMIMRGFTGGGNSTTSSMIDPATRYLKLNNACAATTANSNNNEYLMGN